MTSATSSIPVIAGTPTGAAMALASVLNGLEAQPVRVEVTCTRGPGGFQLVGLAEAAVKEARVRVSGALAHLGVLLNSYAVTVNLAPADLRKSGAALDLAIALATLAAIDLLDPRSLQGVLLVGELSLDGVLRPVTGVLPRLNGATHDGVHTAIVPPGNAAEAGLARGLRVLAAPTLLQLLQHLRGEAPLSVVPPTEFVPTTSSIAGDMAEVRGQSLARRSLELAAAGGHNLLFIGPPGSGKTLLARLLPTVLPPLELEEAMECTAIHSVAGTLPHQSGVISERPFRSPHHSVSEAGLVGGGDVPRPGEVSLAHHGVLFLDELAEFRRSALESLRQPLEDGRVCIARARARAWFPARPLLVAAVNPCPCGFGYWPPRRTAQMFASRGLSLVDEGAARRRYLWNRAVPPAVPRDRWAQDRRRSTPCRQPRGIVHVRIRSPCDRSSRGSGQTESRTRARRATACGLESTEPNEGHCCTWPRSYLCGDIAALGTSQPCFFSARPTRH